MRIYSALCQQRTYVVQPAKPLGVYWPQHFEPAPPPHVVVPRRAVVKHAHSRLRSALPDLRDLLALRECALIDLAEAVAGRATLTAEEAALLVPRVRRPDTQVASRRTQADENASVMTGDRL